MESLLRELEPIPDVNILCVGVLQKLGVEIGGHANSVVHLQFTCSISEIHWVLISPIVYVTKLGRRMLVGTTFPLSFNQRGLQWRLSKNAKVMDEIPSQSQSNISV